MLKLFGKKLTELFRGGTIEQQFYEELEDLLIEGDVGVVTASSLIDSLQQEIKKQGLRSREEALKVFRGKLEKIVKSAPLPIQKDRLNVFLVLGVNGVGKTTTIAKLAYHFRVKEELHGIVFAAADTFRAGAIQQLDTLAAKAEVRVVKQTAGADPGAVIFDAMESAKARGEKLVLADTAGRMHNRTNLVRELQKVDKIIKGKIDSGNYKKVLVLDAVTGQNGLRQAEIFHETIGVDSIILTKWDGTAKGGIVLSIGGELGIPLSFVGAGEKITDLLPFDPLKFVENLVGGT